MHIIHLFVQLSSMGYNGISSCCGRKSNSSSLPQTSSNEETPLLGFTGRHQYENFRHSMSAFQVCLYHGLCYYSLAVLGFSFLVEEWSIVDSLYFATVVFTTIGYGDMSPTTRNAKLFTMFMSLYGIVILGIFLGVAGEMVVEIHNKATTVRQTRVQGKLVTKLADNTNESSTMEEEKEKERTLLQDIHSILLKELPIMVILLIIGLAVGHAEGWTLIDSVWWLVVSGTTVGLGDYHPSRPVTRIFCIFFLPLLVAVLGELLARIASAYMDRKQDENEKKFFSRSLQLSDLSVMDTDEDGKVERYEFLSYMLVALQKVSAEDVEEVMALFRRLDVDGNGRLTKDDLLKKGWEQAIVNSMANNNDPLAEGNSGVSANETATTTEAQR